METLEKIDLLRRRMNVSYQKASKALEQNEGNVLNALLSLEKEQTGGAWEGGKKLQQRVIKVRRGKATLYEFPAEWGILGMMALITNSKFMLVAGTSALAARMMGYSLSLEHRAERAKFG